jgi:hypothetical protein
MTATFRVTDGLWPVMFTGKSVAFAKTEKKVWPGQHWYEMEAWLQRKFLQWVEMEIWAVDPGQEYNPDGEGDRIRLPSGGYFLQVTGQSVCYHAKGSACDGKGVPTAAGETAWDSLPCPDCKPPRIWDSEPQPDGRDDDVEPGLLVPAGLEVRAESSWFTLHRSVTARGIVTAAEGARLSGPARQLLEIAIKADPAFAAVFDPAP